MGKKEKLTKKEKKAKEQAKFEKWSSEWTDKNRADDEAKAKRVRAEREKEERKKTTLEKHMPKYEVWGNKDQRGKVMIDRYHLHDEKTPEQRQAERHAAAARRPASSVVASKLPSSYRSNEPVLYTPKITSDVHNDGQSAEAIHGAVRSAQGQEPPRPTAFGNSMVELRHKNNVCYWPVPMVTRENLTERFGLKRPAMRLASVPKGPLAIKYKPLADGSYQVQGGQVYVVFNLKDTDKKIKAETAHDSPTLTYEQKVVQFLIMAKFTRGEVLGAGSSGGGQNRMIREESLQFTPEGRFVYKEFKGYKDVEGSLKQQIMLVGKYKLKNKHQSVHLTFDKEKKKSKSKNDRSQDTVAERKALYQKFWIPGDGSLQCLAEPSLRFK